MATPPTFTSGSILTAAQMNAVGLWLVKSQTVGSGVSSVTVTGAFSADYDNYHIVYDAGVTSATTDFKLTLGSTATGYTTNMVYSYFNATTVAATFAANAAYWVYVGGGSTAQAHSDFDLYAPYLAKNTILTNANWIQVAAAGGTGRTTGFLADTTSYTAFTLGTVSGTMTGGTISVYGYRK